ncbi:DUF1616 domain-containing protein [Chloroflexota bacterium]
MDSLYRRGQKLLDRILRILLVAAIVASIVILGYVIAIPRIQDEFTEFYILGVEDKTINHPTDLKAREEGKVIVGVINHEKVEVTYQVEVRIDGIKNNEVGPIVLTDGQIWKEIVSFTPDSVGDRQKVEFLLYKNEGNEVYLSVHFWVNVQE